MALKQIDHGTDQYKRMVDLRYSVLRAPLGLSFSREDLEREKNDILIVNEDDDEVIGCCVLTEMEPGCVRLRQMAVSPRHQKRGVGEGLLMFAERLARDKGYERITMHARDSAQGFYDKFGYQIKGDVFTEVTVPHHLMEKKLR